MGGTGTRLYRHAGGALLRAAALPLNPTPVTWPELTDPASCRSWLRETWALPGFAEALGYASDSFAAKVEAVIDQQVTDERQVRRVTLSVVRYLLRALGRPTPFGLFAGVAPVEVGDAVRASWGARHLMLVRAGMLWLDSVLQRLEASPEVLLGLNVVVSDLIVDRGERIEVPYGPGRVSVRNTAVVRLVREAATNPIRISALADKVSEAFPGVPASTITGTLGDLVAQGVLITNLRAPMTVTDPLDHVIEALSGSADHVDEAAVAFQELHGIQRVISAHDGAVGDPVKQARLRTLATERMRRLSPVGRTPLAGDLHLDCHVTVPAALAAEMELAATALLRLTRQPRPDPTWNDWCREFCDRYGTGAVVPVTEAVHPDAGIGWPTGYPSSVLADPPEAPASPRDEALARLAWEAGTAGDREIVLTDDVIDAITAERAVDPRWIPPHVELGARVHAESQQALQSGDYTFTVRPAWAYGTLTSRFGPAVTDSGLDAVYARTPSNVAGALPVQLSFPPLFPHSENVARSPAHLRHVLSLGEHRPITDPNVIGVDDLGIVAVADGLHLVSISRRRIIEPQVFHALALKKQAPPLARFLATLRRGFLARYTEFDWGPLAGPLPYLPRVRYGRAILSPATWRITPNDDAAMRSAADPWSVAFGRWRQKWSCPDVVELHDEHRSLRLDLTAGTHLRVLREHLDKHGHARLTETETPAEVAWIGGHIHEIVMPFTRATPAAPSLITGSWPLVTNRSGHRPAAPESSWLYAQVFTHPERLDDIIGTHLPRLLAEAGDPAYWFARYRSLRETPHLRLRLRVTGPDRYAAMAKNVGRWGQQLCEAGAASRIALATYHPELGRYGSTQAAMDAAEDVFTADSHAVALALRLRLHDTIHPIALTAIGMTEIADGFHADKDAANTWLVAHLSTRSDGSTPRSVADQVELWAKRGTLPNGPSVPGPLNAAWTARRAALARYRNALPGDADTDQILSALLHMHHNRARLIDRTDEAVCQRLARRIALVRCASKAGSTR